MKRVPHADLMIELHVDTAVFALRSFARGLGFVSRYRHRSPFPTISKGSFRRCYSHLPLACPLSELLACNRAGLTLQPVEKACCSYRRRGWDGNLWPVRAMWDARAAADTKHNTCFSRRIFLCFPFLFQEMSVAATFSPLLALSDVHAPVTRPRRVSVAATVVSGVSDDGPIGNRVGRAAGYSLEWRMDRVEDVGLPVWRRATYPG